MSAPDLRDVIQTAVGSFQADARNPGGYLQQLTDHLVTAVEPLAAGAVAERDAQIVQWLIKKAREFHASRRKQEREQGDTCAVLASKIARGAVRANNTLMLPHPGFFEVDHTYTRPHHGQPITFKVEAISTSPDGRLRLAHGWRTDPYSGWDPFDSDDLTGWTDVTEAGDR